VPRRANLITVLGAVPRPGSVPYVEGHNAQAYLNLSGGFREDAAGNRMIVVTPTARSARWASGRCRKPPT